MVSFRWNDLLSHSGYIVCGDVRLKTTVLLNPYLTLHTQSTFWTMTVDECVCDAVDIIPDHVDKMDLAATLKRFEFVEVLQEREST